MTEHDIRWFDFNNELIFDLADPEVHAAYTTWRDLVEMADKKSFLDLTPDESAALDAAREAFSKIARQKGAVRRLT